MLKSKRSQTGFTLVEVLVITIIIGILSLVVAPSWLAFISRQQLRTSTDQLYWAMQTARSEAKRERTTWQASFRQSGNRAQWSVHPARVPPTTWNNLEKGVQIDPDQTRLKCEPAASGDEQCLSNSNMRFYRVLFNYKGCPIYTIGNECNQTSLKAMGTVTLKHQNLGEYRRCVIISTLLGAIRTDQDQSKSTASGNACYRKK
ncbi:MAG: pilus assembly FimT family protein [Microcoleaceae cyanobacterium]